MNSREDAVTGAVVLMVNVTGESWLPAATCAGLKLQLVKAGSLEQENLTVLGNDPIVGFTSKLKIAARPTGVEALVGDIPKVKSKV